MDRDTIRTLMLVGVLLGAASAAAISGFTNPAPVSDGVPLGAPSGLYVTVEGDTNISAENFTQGDDTIVLQTTDGNATVQSDGVADVSLRADEITGTWTNATAISAGLNPVTIDPEDKTAATVGGDIERVAFRDASDIAADDGQADFYYGGSSGQSRVTIEGAPGDTQLGAVDADSGALLDVATSDSNGQITFDELDNSNHTVELQTTDGGPTLENGAPSGDLSTEPNELSVDVDDPDFDSDTVTVNFSVDGSQIDSQSTSSADTLTADIPDSAQTGGTHNVNITATDEYGQTTTETYSYRVPATLEFRSERADHDLIKNDSNPITIEAIFFEDSESDPVILDKTTTDGTIDLTGLPVGSEFSVSVQAPGYNNRTVRLDSLYDQEAVYMLENDVSPLVENRFVLNDRTGSFPPEETEISVQAPVNESLYDSDADGFEWKTVSGDDLGADQAFVDVLEEEKRYRIIVENNQGDQRNLGSYSPEVAGTIELNIGSLDTRAQEPNGVGFNATYQNTTDGKEIQVEYNDSAQATDELFLSIYERNNESNALLENQSFAGPFGTFRHVESVPEQYNETVWVVEVHGARGTGEDGEQRENVVFKETVGPGFNVLNDMPDWLVTVIFVGLMWGVAGTFSQVNGHVGGIVVAGLGAMFFFVGLVPNYLGGGVVALSLLTAGILFVRGSRGGGI